MKKIFSILLVFILCYNAIGFYLNFEFRRRQIRKEVKHKILYSLPDKALALIKVPTENYGDIVWTKVGREFLYNDNMYDIVRSQTKNDTIYYYCYNDKKETNLLYCYSKIIKERTGYSKSKIVYKKRLINYLHQKLVFEQPIADESCRICSYYLSGYRSVVKDVLTPPPNSIS